VQYLLTLICMTACPAVGIEFQTNVRGKILSRAFSCWLNWQQQLTLQLFRDKSSIFLLPHTKKIWHTCATIKRDPIHCERLFRWVNIVDTVAHSKFCYPVKSKTVNISHYIEITKSFTVAVVSNWRHIGVHQWGSKPGPSSPVRRSSHKLRFHVSKIQACWGVIRQQCWIFTYSWNTVQLLNLL